MIFRLDNVGKLFVKFAFRPDEERRHPEQVFHAHRLNAFSVVFEIGEFLFRKEPVADHLIPCGDRLRRDAFHDVETPTVVDDQRAEAEPGSDFRIFLHPVLCDCRMNRIPCAENRFPRALRKFRQRQGKSFAPVRQRVGPDLRALVDDELEILRVFAERHFNRDVVGAFFLIHLCKNPCIVREIRQTGGETVDLSGIEERDEREGTLPGAFAFDHPYDFCGRRTAFRHPVSVHVEDRHGKAHLHDAAVTGDLDREFAVISAVFQRIILLRLIKETDFHFCFLSMNSGLMKIEYGGGGALPSRMSARSSAAVRER